jgi:hypothetical protein
MFSVTDSPAPHGKYAGIPEIDDAADRYAAWAEMTKPAVILPPT